MKRLIKLLMVIFFLALVYAGWKVVPFFMYNWELRSAFRQQIKRADVYRDSEIRERLGQDMRQLGIPAVQSQILIRRDDQKMEIRLKYKEVFFINFRGQRYVIWEFPFDTIVVDQYK